MSVGNDDLDLDGNWASNDPDVVDESLPTSGKSSKTKKGVKRKQKSSEADTPTIEATPSAKKRKKKGGKVLAAVVDAEKAPQEGIGTKELRHWALTRVATSWVAECKASRLTPLEAKEVRPLPSWFVACKPTISIGRLPWEATLSLSKSQVDFPGSSTLSAARDGKGKTPKVEPQNISVLVLCSSTDRVFKVKAEIEEAWKVKALALAAHGGGRKKDQVARQAKAIAAGVAVAVATPARLLRLLSEEHISPENLSLVVLDCERDRKQRDVLTLAESRGDLFKLLRQHFLSCLPSKDDEGFKGLAFLLCSAAADA
eukprot:TRINITY_DN12978_c0_g2_i1.p1 TRINITY_DN12978_c0_g2~~TRINITY_DN12978_c0_g2_i1.p1  ORF type:complete len:339 (-),score=74.97 TRINITY_DN12978_c0_g2_i1:61-1002(-)